MGGGTPKGASTTNTVQNQNQQYTAAPQVQQASGQALSAAESAAATPFSQPVAPVAGFNPTQNQAFNQYQNIQGMASPYYQAASGLYGQAGQSPNVASFYNPMAANVTAQLQNIFGQQNSQNNASLTNAAGGVGADRIAVGQGELANQQTLAAGQTYANLYQQATSAAQAQQQMEQQAAQGFTNLGTTAENTALQGTGALLGAGNQQQQQTQAQLNAPYQNILAQLAYPFQTAQYLSGITGQQAPVQGGTTIGAQNTNQVGTPAQPTLLSQLLGAGAGAAGIYGALGGFGGSGLNTGQSIPGTSGPTSVNGAPLNYAAEGGSIYPLLASGGDSDDSGGETIDTTKNNSVVPNIPVTMGAGHSGPLTGAMTFAQPPAPQQSQASNPLGDVANIAKAVLPFFALKSGGQVPKYADGDAVDAPSEEVPDFSTTFAPPNMNDSFRDRWNALTPTAPTVKQGLLGAPPGPGEGITLPFADRFGAARPSGVAPSSAAMIGPPAPVTPPVAPNSAYPPVRVDPKTGRIMGNITESSSVVGKPAADDEDMPAPPANVNSTPAQIMKQMMPTARQPYPDAAPQPAQRDWGQTATRSPWLALINAGAKIMSTPGTLGQSVGQGITAGTKTLDDQRKELQSEEQINQKAMDLYEKASEHLDKYNKMTPYERGSLLARNKEIDQSYSATQKALDAKVKYWSGVIASRPDAATKSPQQIKTEAEMMARQEGVNATSLAGNAPGSVKPPSIVQNGNTYNLQPDGTYK